MPFAALVGFETLLEEERARHCAQYEREGNQEDLFLGGC